MLKRVLAQNPTKIISAVCFVLLMPLFAMAADAPIVAMSEKCDCKTMRIGVVPLAATSVSVGNFSFSGQTITINVGDTVTWTVTQGAHTVSDNRGAYDSGNLNPGDTFRHTFNTPGSFPYFCKYHIESGMIGTVIVQGSGPAGQPPVITSATTATAVVGANFSYTLTATGSPAPTLSFTNVPAGLQAASTSISGILTAPGTVMVGLHASNSAGNADATLAITVIAQVAAPAITSPLTASAIVGADFNYIISATGTPAIGFGASNLPTPLVLNGATISGRFASAGSYTIGLTASNAGGLDSKNLVVTATASNEGISGTWTGKSKGKQFDQTVGAPQNASDTKTTNVSFTQTGNDLFATLDFGGLTTFSLKGRIGMGNFWVSGSDATGQSTVTLSGHVAKNGKSLKGTELLFRPADGEELTFSLTKK